MIIGYPDAVGQTFVKVPNGLTDGTIFTIFDGSASNVDEHSDRECMLHEMQRIGFNRWGATPRSEVLGQDLEKEKGRTSAPSGVPSQALSVRNATTRDRWHHAAGTHHLLASVLGMDFLPFNNLT